MTRGPGGARDPRRGRLSPACHNRGLAVGRRARLDLEVPQQPLERLAVSVVLRPVRRDTRRGGAPIAIRSTAPCGLPAGPSTTTVHSRPGGTRAERPDRQLAPRRPGLTAEWGDHPMATSKPTPARTSFYADILLGIGVGGGRLVSPPVLIGLRGQSEPGRGSGEIPIWPPTLRACAPCPPSDSGPSASFVTLPTPSRPPSPGSKPGGSLEWSPIPG
jgi:hypothetical protein